MSARGVLGACGDCLAQMAIAALHAVAALPKWLRVVIAKGARP